ncbi:hypothetical protein AMTRI_Chr06g174050 [Amborella trichopoda]
MVQPTVLYGCAKKFKTNFFLQELQVKQVAQYDIMLLNAKLIPQEVEAIYQFVVFAQHFTTSVIDKISK